MAFYRQEAGREGAQSNKGDGIIISDDNILFYILKQANISYFVKSIKKRSTQLDRLGELNKKQQKYK